MGDASRLAVTKLEDAIRILRLRRAGFSISEISESLDIAVPQVRSLLSQSMKELGLLKEEEASELRLIENERLDKMMQAIWTRAEEGSLVHIAAVLKIMERRAKLLALDMKVEGDGKDDKFVVIPAWAAKPKPEDIESTWEDVGDPNQRALPADSEVVDGEQGSDAA